MRKALVYIMILAVSCIALGVFAGIALERRYIQRHLPRVIGEYMRKYPKEERQKKKVVEIIRQVDRALGLSRQEKENIRQILGASWPEANRAQEEYRRSLLQIREKALSDIAQSLSPEKKAKFNRFIERQRKRQDRLAGDDYPKKNGIKPAMPLSNE